MTPTAVPQPNGQRPPHCLFAACIALAAFLAVYFSAFSLPYHDWSDAADYQAAGMYMVGQGGFMPAAIAYADLLEHGTRAFGLSVWDYPNYGYSLLLGAIGFARGAFTTLGGIWVAALATLGIGFAAYAFFSILSGDARLALLFSVGVLFHRLTLDLAAMPRPDILLLLFLLLALICMARGHHLAAGVLLGIGYLFREHALIFLPFLPLLSPQADTLRGFLRAGALTVLGFVPALAAAYGIKLHFTSGSLQENFYLKHHTSFLATLLQPESAIRLLKHLRSHLSRLGPMAWLALGFVVLRYRHAPPPARRMVLLAVIFSLIPCLMWVERPHVPNRYALYSVPLYLAALLLCLRGYRHGALVAAALLFAATSLFAYKTIQTHDSAKMLLSPREAAARLERDLEAPWQLRREFKPGSVVIAERTGVVLLGLDKPVPVTPPDFAVFMRSAGNEKVDGIFVKRGAEWPDCGEFTDQGGVRFLRVALPESLAVEHICYKRAEPLRAR